MLLPALQPTCPTCGRGGFLSLLPFPQASLTDALQHLLPSLHDHAPSLPPAAILAAIPTVVNWLGQFPPTLPPRAFRTTPPIHVGDRWSSFWTLDYSSDWTHEGAQRPRPLEYSRLSDPISEWMLTDGPPPPCTILASHCATCGRPSPHTAAVALAPHHGALMPSLFCTSTRRQPPYCTRALAPRCHFYQQDQQLRGAVPVHDLPWTELCCPRLPTTLLPPPPYLRSLPSPAQPDADLLHHTALVIMTHNWGGIALQTALARLWVEALQPDVLCWHELWDRAAARLAIPATYETIWSTATGPGTGFVVAWRGTLRRRPDEATLAYDGEHSLCALLPLWHVGRLLVCNVHLHPKITYKEWLRQLRHMDQLRRDLRPDFTYITGDFNSTDAPGAPLAQALRPGGTLSDYQRVIPSGTPTNHTVVLGRPRSTAIDHSFLHGPIAAAHHQLLPSRSSHAVIVVTVTLHTQSADAWGWRRFRWRRAAQEDMEIMATAFDLVWGWLLFAPALPDDYVAAHHAVAGQLIPRPPDKESLLRRLARQTFPLSPDRPDQQITALREAAEERGYRDRLEVLRTASITAATRAALHLPSPPLEPFSGILPRPGAVLPTREERLHEVQRQSSAQTCNRHLPLDCSWFQARCDPGVWSSMRRPTPELPTPQLLALLRAGLQPDDPASSRRYLDPLNALPLLTTASVAERRMGRPSLAVSSDNIPRSLLFRSGGGVHTGLLHSLLQAEAGTPTVLNETVRYGIYKGRPGKALPRHLARSFRPVDVESSASGTLSGIAADRLAVNLEVSGSYTPVVFSYRTAHSTSSMAIVGRAAVYCSLVTRGSCAVCDWDESDAYLRVVRESTGDLLRCLPGVWDYSAWAHKYYSRLVIRVITRDGFAPPFSTGEGGNQGDAFAALHYQTPSHIITQTMEVDSEITLPLDLPGHSASLPATVLVYSDDRRFIHPTLAGAVNLAESCRDASRRAGRIVHPDKLEYFMLRLLRNGIVLESAPVPESDSTTATTPPDLVGIPLLPELPKYKSLNKSLHAIRAVHKATERGPAAPALRLRALHSFGPPVLDYVSGGVLFTQDQLRPHQKATDSVYLAAFRLPPWTQRSLLRLPLRLGGFGTPDVAHRSHLQLLTSYLRASWSTNLLAVAAAHYILTLPPRGGWEPEGTRLRDALRPLQVTVHTDPKPLLRPSIIHSVGEASHLSRLSFVVAATDGSQVDTRLGAGFALWHPSRGIFYRQWFGVHVCAGHSTDAEWLAKIALLLLLADWRGEVLLVTDSTAALTAGLSRAPHSGSLLSIPYRAALTSSRAHLREAWLPAQHDSDDSSLLARLNAEADALADAGARAVLPYTVPWLPMYAGRLLATQRGCLILQPRNAADVVAEHASESLYTRTYPAPDRSWSSSLLIAAVEAADIAPRAVHLTMLHRLLMHQRHPPGYGGVLCPYCHLAFSDITNHLLRECPPFFLQHLHLSWRLLRHHRVLPLLTLDPRQSALRHGTEVVTPQVHVGLLTGLHQPEAPSAPAPSHLFLRLSGEWQVASDNPRHPPLLAAHRQEVYADHLDALDQPPPTLPMALTAAPDLWPATAPPLPVGVQALALHPPLAVRDSVALGWLLRRCRAWQLVTGYPPSVPLPPMPTPKTTPALVLCALQCSKADALSLLRQAPAVAPLVVLSTATIVDYLQPHCREPLTLLPLPEGLMVGSTLGAPLNTTDWPADTK